MAQKVKRIGGVGVAEGALILNGPIKIFCWPGIAICVFRWDRAQWRVCHSEGLGFDFCGVGGVGGKMWGCLFYWKGGGVINMGSGTQVDRKALIDCFSGRVVVCRWDSREEMCYLE